MSEKFIPPIHSTAVAISDVGSENTAVLRAYASDNSINLSRVDNCVCEIDNQHTAVLEQLFHAELGYPIVNAHVPFRLTNHDGANAEDIDIYRFPYGLTEAGTRAAFYLSEMSGIETVGFTRYMARIGFAAVMNAEVAKRMLAKTLADAGCADLTIGSKPVVGFRSGQQTY